MQILITGKKVQLTDAIEGYVIKKISGLEKFFKGIIRADTVVGEDTKRHKKGNVFFAECKLEVPGYDLFVRRDATSLYAAIDDLKDHLELELKKHKSKLRGNAKETRKFVRNSKEYSAE